jgi:hydroxyacylglutathione hydrolase
VLKNFIYGGKYNHLQNNEVAMVKVYKFTYNAVMANTWVVAGSNKECVIIDPGCASYQEQQQFKKFIEDENLKPVALLNTHCHVDHVPGNAFVAETWCVKLSIHENELPLLHAAPQYGALFGIQCPPSPEPDAFLIPGNRFEFSDVSLQLLFTPGHSPGSISFYDKANGYIISGDVLFKLSIGRYDLPGSDGNTLFESIRNQLFTLPDSTIVYCGHGPDTSIGFEKQHNPFFN